MFGIFCGDCWLCKRKLLILNEFLLKGFFSFNSNELTWVLKDDLCNFKTFAVFQKNIKEMLMEQIY